MVPEDKQKGFYECHPDSCQSQNKPTNMEARWQLETERVRLSILIPWGHSDSHVGPYTF
jgi:hypothetical protein